MPRTVYPISAPCKARLKVHPTIYLEGEDKRPVAHVCPICIKEWDAAERDDIANQMAALESNWKDYEYPVGARGHFTGD